MYNIHENVFYIVDIDLNYKTVFMRMSYIFDT